MRSDDGSRAYRRQEDRNATWCGAAGLVAAFAAPPPSGGRDAVDQAQQIVDHVAHPDAREALRIAGRDLGFPLT